MRMRTAQETREIKTAFALLLGPILAVLAISLALETPCKFIYDHDITFAILSITLGVSVYKFFGRIFPLAATGGR